jgi:putative transposase
MEKTYTQIHIHAVFAVKNRQSLIQPEWKDRLCGYITGIIQKNGHKMLAINGTTDHIHIFFGMRPVQSLSDLMQDVKGDSSKWINENKFIKLKFAWQRSFSAFSYSRSHVYRVIRYIQNQEEHHKKIRFTQEHIDSLKKFEIEYDPRYILKSID